MEYGIANVLEQYETKYKARQLLGDMGKEESMSGGMVGKKKQSGSQGKRRNR